MARVGAGPRKSGQGDGDARSLGCARLAAKAKKRVGSEDRGAHCGKVAHITLAADISPSPKARGILASVMVMGMRWAMVLTVFLSSLGWAAIETRGPLLINSVEDLLGIATGLGTVISPFVIENLRVDANGEPFGILVANISAPLVIRNVEIYGAGVAAIRVQNVQNLTIENVVARGSLTGILIAGSKKITVRKSRIENCADGIRVMFSEEIALRELLVQKNEVGIWFQGVRLSTLTDSMIQTCGLGLLFELESKGNLVANNAFLGNHVHAQSCGGNQFDDGKRGNFWEGFLATDSNADGILDEAYQVGLDYDRFPLAFPP